MKITPRTTHPSRPPFVILKSEGDVLGFNEGKIASEHNASSIIADRNETVCQEFKSCRNARTLGQSLVRRERGEECGQARQEGVSSNLESFHVSDMRDLVPACLPAVLRLPLRWCLADVYTHDRREPIELAEPAGRTEVNRKGEVSSPRSAAPMASSAELIRPNWPGTQSARPRTIGQDYRCGDCGSGLAKQSRPLSPSAWRGASPDAATSFARCCRAGRRWLRVRLKSQR